MPESKGETEREALRFSFYPRFTRGLYGVRVFATRSTTQDAIDRFSSRRRRRLVAPPFSFLSPYQPPYLTLLFPFVDSLRVTLPRDAVARARLDSLNVDRTRATTAFLSAKSYFCCCRALSNAITERNNSRWGQLLCPRYEQRVRECVWDARTERKKLFLPLMNQSRYDTMRRLR